MITSRPTLPTDLGAARETTGCNRCACGGSDIRRADRRADAPGTDCGEDLRDRAATRHGPAADSRLGIPVYPLKPGQEAYADVDGYRIKETIKKITAFSLQSLDAGDLDLGTIPGTRAHQQAMDFMASEYAKLGLEVRRQPVDMAPLWYPTRLTASYASGGKTGALQTLFPITDTRATPPGGITADAVWVGVGAAPDLAGRDLQGQGGPGLQHVRARRTQPFRQRPRRHLQLGHAGDACGRRDDHQCDGRARQRPVQSGRCARRPGRGADADHQPGRRVHAARHARRRAAGAAERAAGHRRADRPEDGKHLRHAARPVGRADRGRHAHGRLLPGRDGQCERDGDRHRHRPPLRRHATIAAPAHDRVHGAARPSSW